MVWTCLFPGAYPTYTKNEMLLSPTDRKKGNNTLKRSPRDRGASPREGVVIKPR